MSDLLTISNLLDREAIRDCIYRCAMANDMRDPIAWKAAYWPDGHEDHQPLFVGNAHEFVDAMVVLLDRTMQTVWHQFSGTIVRVEESSARAISYAHAHVLMKETEANPSFNLRFGLRYLDQFEKRDGEWRILRRITHADWMTQTPVVEPIMDMGGDPIVGMHSPRDPARTFFPDGIQGLLVMNREEA